MRIDFKGRNVAVTDEIRGKIEKRFAKIAKQVSDQARMEVELSEERNPRVKASHVVEATLHLKGVSLRARDSSTSWSHAINLVAEELARQVKRHRDKRRGRREARSASPPPASAFEPLEESPPAGA
jgi:putative sigma-54 modulation protein